MTDDQYESAVREFLRDSGCPEADIEGKLEEMRPHSPELHVMARKHFNEPMLAFGKLVRCVGYGETAVDCYIIVKDRDGKESWNTCVGGYTFLHLLKGQGCVTAHNGEEWSDFTRLETDLSPKEHHFKLVLNHDDHEGFPPRDENQS